MPTLNYQPFCRRVVSCLFAIYTRLPPVSTNPYIALSGRDRPRRLKDHTINRFPFILASPSEQGCSVHYVRASCIYYYCYYFSSVRKCNVGFFSYLVHISSFLNSKSHEQIKQLENKQEFSISFFLNRHVCFIFSKNTL